MKQKDITLIIMVVIFSSVFSIVLSNIVVSPKKRQTKVEVVDAISEQFTLPDKKYINTDSINPTRLIRIGDTSNTQPFITN